MQSLQLNWRRRRRSIDRIQRDFAENLNAPEIIKAYRERSLLTDEDITYTKDDAQHFAHVTGIDDSGGLVITNKNGEEEILRAGEVFLVRAL